ncbi:sulfate/molybdate ABC transporter ATP-binding protein [Arthrobacter sp. 7Tela_A1]|uniref:sulfate/molybdate ABC transporter ATP-binding protein n=1 Tax=Arthrobacter sp. 7Tela_A1 TaxID=3093745 RepID=UPI003BB67F9E
MSLHLAATVPERGVDVDLRLAEGETVALLGPNGAGKSTVVSLIAGLVHPEAGRAELGGRTLFNLAGSRGAFVPAHRRGTALLAQEPLLFPHLSARENVAFGPRSTGSRRKAALAAADRWLAEVDATDLARRRPSELSGGQAQRVALARALAAEPALLLLDEPMAALDVEAVPLMRRLLKRVLAGRSALIVTHDVLDALTLADRVLVMQEGRIVESGPASVVLRRPRSQFTASLAGLNLVTGIRKSGGFAAEGFTLPGVLPEPAGGEGTRWLAAFPPSSVAVHRAGPEHPGVAHPAGPGGGAHTLFRARVTDLEPQGDRIRVRAGGLAADVSPSRAAELGLDPGQDVILALDPQAMELYPE